METLKLSWHDGAYHVDKPGERQGEYVLAQTAHAEIARLTSALVVAINERDTALIDWTTERDRADAFQRAIKSADNAVVAAVARAERAEAEVAAMKSKTYCAYCGKEYAIDTDALLVAEHIATCDRHPMRVVEIDLDAALARVREVEEERDRLMESEAELAKRLAESERETYEWANEIRRGQ